MEYIYVRTTRIEHVTPEWAEGRSHVVQHVEFVAYPAESKVVADYLAWLNKMPSKLLQAYVMDYERWHTLRRVWERQRARDTKWLKRRAQRWQRTQRLELVERMEYA